MVNSVNFGNSPDAQDYQIQQAQQLAQLLQQQSMQPIDTATPNSRISWTQGLAKLMQGYQAGNERRKVSDLLNQRTQEAQDKQAALVDALTGNKQLADLPGSPGGTVGQLTPTQGQQPFYNRDMLTAALSGVTPEQGTPALSSILMQRAAPAQGFTGTLGADQTAYSNGQPVAVGKPKTYEGDNALVNIVKPDAPGGYITKKRSEVLPGEQEYIKPTQDRMQVVQDVDKDGKPILKLIDTTQNGRTVNPRVGTPSAGVAGDARAQNMNDRVFAAANEAAIDIHNLSLMPLDISSGLQGVGSTPGHSIFSIAGDALKTELAGEDVQSYNKVVTGLAQNVATAEAGGLAPNMARVKSFDGLLLRPGDTPLSKLQSMAGLRQNVEKVVEVKLRNPRVPQEQKDLLTQILASVKQDVPFTVEDVIKLSAAKHPGRKTLSGAAAAMGLGPQANDVRSQADAILGH